MKEIGKKFGDTKMPSIYNSNKPKPLSYVGKSEKYPIGSFETKNLLSGQSSCTIYRDSVISNMAFSVRFDESAPSNETRAYVWAVALKNEKLISRLIVDDNEIKNVPLDLPNQRVIKNDCMRTRVGIFTDSMRENLEKILAYYCKKEKITYKQGMNEVAAPFVYFQEAQVNLSNIYNYLVLFIDRFLPTSFIDKDFLSLQCYFRTLELLIKYHDPNFHTFLIINDLPSELYATPWFLTLFSSKMNLDMVYFLWDTYILENDNCFKFFLGLALLLENKNTILSSETSMIPQTITNLTVQNATQMKQIFKRAVDLRLRTPASFIGKIRDLDIFKKDYLSDSDMKSGMEKTVEYLESLQCALVSPHEIINTLYHNAEISCSDPECVNYRSADLENVGAASRFDARNRSASSDIAKQDKMKKAANSNDFSYFESPKGHRKNRHSREFKSQCVLCQAQAGVNTTPTPLSTMPHLKDLVSYKQNLKAEIENEPPLDFFIIDLRQNKNGGFLPRSYQVKFTKQLEETINLLINDYIELQGQCHFVFMTTSFNSWAFKDLLETKKTKNKRSVRGTFKSEKSEYSGNVSVEDQWLMAFLNAFIQNGFPYLSILEGGFNEINKHLHSLNLETINHNPEYCSVCRVDGGTNRPSFLNFVTKVIDKTGEKIGMLVDGINRDNSFTEGNRIKSRASTQANDDRFMAKTSQGFFNSRKDDEITSPSRDIPQSESTQETGDYFQASSTYTGNSEQAADPSLESLNSFPKYVQMNYHTAEDYPVKPKESRFESAERNYPGRGLMSNKPINPGSPFRLTHQFTTPSQAMQSSSGQSPFAKSNSVLYSQSVLEPKVDFGPPKSTYTGNGATISMHSSPRAEITDFMFKDKKITQNQDFLSDDGEESKFKKQGGPQDKKNVLSLHFVGKSKSNDKGSGYNSNYNAAPPLPKIVKNGRYEEESRTKFYSTEFNSAKPFETHQQPTDKDLHDKSTNKDTSLVDSIYGDTLSENRTRPGSVYNNVSTPKAFLESYTKQIGPASTSSNSKKGTITQILKETTTGMTQYNEPGSETNLSSYQAFSKSALMTYQTIPQEDVITRSQQESNIYLENIGGNLSIRGINPIRTIAQSPSPEKAIDGKMTDRFELKKKDVTIDTTLLYSNYADLASPVQADLLRSALNRVEEGKMSSRPYSSNDSSYYERNGIFKEFKLSQNGVFWLYKTFEGVEFSLYSCDYMKDPSRDEVSLTPISSTTGASNSLSSRRIMAVSKDFLVSLDYNKDVYEDLKLLQVGVSVDRVLKQSQHKSYGKGFQSTHDPFDQGLLSPKQYLNGRDSSGQKDKFGSFDNSFDSFSRKVCDVTVVSIFPVKLLLRITSKKADAKFLSFYFKLPALEKIRSMNASRFFDFSEHTIQELPYLMKKEEYVRMLREVSDLKDAGLLQSKSVYRFETDSDAQECIQKTRDAYNYASSYINETLRKNTRI